ncbi:hypothetical protein ACFL2Y_01375 [Candidatus Omnitrophota bacterium]
MFLGTFESNKVWKGWGKFPDEIFVDKQEKAKIESLYNSFNHYMIEGTIKIREYDQSFMELALKRIRGNFARCFKTWITRIPRLWYQNYIPMYYPLVEASGSFFIFYFIFALLAVLFSRGQEKILMAPIGFLFIYLTLIFLPLHIEPRYGVALMPGIIALTGIGIWKLFLSIKNFLIRNNLIDFVSEE